MNCASSFWRVHFHEVRGFSRSKSNKQLPKTENRRQESTRYHWIYKRQIVSSQKLHHNHKYFLILNILVYDRLLVDIFENIKCTKFFFWPSPAHFYMKWWRRSTSANQSLCENWKKNAICVASFESGTQETVRQQRKKKLKNHFLIGHINAI